jgi:hypothetical protein
MLKAINILCSEGVSVDIATKSVSVFNIIERITVIGFPVMIPSLCIVAIIERSPSDEEKFTGELRIKNNAQEIMKIPTELDFKGGVINRTIAKLQGIAILQPGILEIIFEVGEENLGSVKFEVTLGGPPTPGIKKIDI